MKFPPMSLEGASPVSTEVSKVSVHDPTHNGPCLYTCLNVTRNK